MNRHHKSVTATVMKNRFGDYLGEVTHTKQPLLIERHGKPVAVLVSFEEWHRRSAPEGRRHRSAWAISAQKLMRRMRRDLPPHRPGSGKSAVELLQEIREEEGSR